MHGSGPSRRSETGMIDVLFVLYRPRRIHPCGLWHLSVPLSLIMHATTTTQKNHPPTRGMDENRAAQTQYGFIIIRVECKTKGERLHY